MPNAECRMARGDSDVGGEDQPCAGVKKLVEY
jgi:hypothetical protein